MTLAEIEVQELEVRRLRAEAEKLEAEARKLRAENDKFVAEQRKSELEAEALHRWRYIAFPVGFVAIVSAGTAAIIQLLTRHP